MKDIKLVEDLPFPLKSKLPPEIKLDLIEDDEFLDLDILEDFLNSDLEDYFLKG